MWMVLFFLAACSTDPATDDTSPDDTGSAEAYGEVTATGGDCEGETFAVAPTPVVWAEAEGRDILLHLDDLTANCCPTPGAEVTLEGSTFSVVFDDLAGGGGCFCECIIDFLVTIEDVDPGTWTLDVKYRGAVLGAAEVTVP